MGSVAWPHGESTPPRIAPVLGDLPGPASSPAGLFPRLDVARPAHLVPCAQCGASNGRSAAACWSCEADLLGSAQRAAPGPGWATGGATTPLPSTQLASVAEAAPEPAGLHLNARSDAAPSVHMAAAPASAPAFDGFDGLDGFRFPPLNPSVDDSFAPPSDAYPYPQSHLPHSQTNRRRSSRPWIAGVLVASLLLAPVGLRWFASSPPDNAPPGSASPVSSAQAAEADRGRPLVLTQQTSPNGRESPSATPSQAALEPAAADTLPPAAAPLDLPPAGGAAIQTEPAPGAQAAAPPVALPMAPMTSMAPTTPRTREIRETISPPSANCTSNMAALGFCTLAPTSAKE